MAFPYLEVTIGFTVALYLFETYLDVRQLIKTREKKRPDPLVKVVTQKKFLQSQSYSFDKNAFQILVKLLGQMKSIGILWYGILPLLWNYSGELLANFGYENEILQSIVLAYIAIVSETIWGIPFSLFSSFVIEEKHGFNKQTLALFITDTIKSILLEIFFGTILVGLMIKVIQWGGEQFYIWVWLFMFVFQLFMLWLYPNVIQPMFNKFDPLPEGRLRNRIEALAASIHFPLSKVYVIDGSRRSAHSNAYFYGFFKNKRIVLFDTLLKEVNEDEILAVLSHELGHWKMNHVLKNLIIIEIHLFVLFFSFGFFINNTNMYNAFGFTTQPILIGLFLFQLIYSPIDHVVNFFMILLSRRFEFQADAYAKKLGYAEMLKSGLIKLQLSNLGNMNPDPWYSTYHYSHPPLIERLRAIGGDFGAEKTKSKGAKASNFQNKSKNQTNSKQNKNKKQAKKNAVVQQPSKVTQRSSKPPSNNKSSKTNNVSGSKRTTTAANSTLFKRGNDKKTK